MNRQAKIAVGAVIVFLIVVATAWKQDWPFKVTQPVQVESPLDKVQRDLKEAQDDLAALKQTLPQVQQKLDETAKATREAAAEMRSLAAQSVPKAEFGSLKERLARLEKQPATAPAKPDPRVAKLQQKADQLERRVKELEALVQQPPRPASLAPPARPAPRVEPPAGPATEPAPQWEMPYLLQVDSSRPRQGIPVHIYFEDASRRAFKTETHYLNANGQAFGRVPVGTSCIRAQVPGEYISSTFAGPANVVPGMGRKCNIPQPGSPEGVTGVGMRIRLD